MQLGLAFWIIMLIWFLFGIYWHYSSSGGWYPAASNGVLFVLFLILGWKVFGAPIHGG